MSSNGVVYSPSKAANFVHPNKPSPLSAATESDGEETADTAAMHVYEKYSRLQRKLELEFKRELADAVGIQNALDDRHRVRRKQLVTSESERTDPSLASSDWGVPALAFDCDDHGDAMDDDRRSVIAESANLVRGAENTMTTSANGAAIGNASGGGGDSPVSNKRRKAQKSGGGTNNTNGDCDKSADAMLVLNGKGDCDKSADTMPVLNGNGAAAVAAVAAAPAAAPADSPAPVAGDSAVAAPTGTSRLSVARVLEAVQMLEAHDKSDAHGRKGGLHKASANGPQNPPLFICEGDNIFTRRLLDEESGNDLLPVADVTVKEVSSATRTQTPRVRASKLEFKRLDHLYNKSIHDFYLAESSRNSNDKDDKWEEYVFIVRRRFGGSLITCAPPHIGQG